MNGRLVAYELAEPCNPPDLTRHLIVAQAALEHRRLLAVRVLLQMPDGRLLRSVGNT